MSIKYTVGDLLVTPADLICHQVNCQGVMGAGLALQIRRAHPNVYKHYEAVCNQYDPEQLLGKVIVRDGVASLFAQLNYGRNKLHTNYSALRFCFTKLRDYAITKNLSAIAIPYGIGCGLAGGVWQVVETIIHDVFKETNLTVIIVLSLE